MPQPGRQRKGQPQSSLAQGPEEFRKLRIGRFELKESNHHMTEAAVGPGEKYCFECGSIIRANAEICPNCGVRQPVDRDGSRNKVVAALLAIFLGGFGIHKFYLGKIGQGILYLLFCWTFIPALVGFFEGIIYLATSDANFERKYG